MQVRFLRPDEAEIEEQVAYFDRQRPGLGDRFEQDLLDTVKFMTDHALTGKPISANIRKLRLRTFPFDVIYAVDAETIAIVAVAHHRRRPGYWRGRLRDVR